MNPFKQLIESRRLSWWLICTVTVLLIATKWLLISQNEIVSEQYDAHQYVMIAQHTETLSTPSIGYPLWLSVVWQTGLPQRLAIEAFWILSSALFGGALARLSKRPSIFPISLAVLLFAPATLFLFDRALTEGFFLCLTLLLATGALALLGARRTRTLTAACVGIGAVSGWMLITRNETLLVGAYLVLLVLGWLLLQRTYVNRPWRELRLRLLIVAGTISFVTALPGLIVSCHNQLRYGIFTVNLAEMPSHMGLLKRLASIDTGTKGRRFIPISRAAREQAYALSPSLAPFRPFVEDPANVYQAVTATKYGTTGEIGAGWIWHVFNQAAPSVGATSPAAIDALYGKINQELDTAFRSGRLRSRFVPHPFLGAETMAWLPHLTEGFQHSLRCVISPATPMPDQYYATEIFNDICLRRQSLIYRETLQLSGWAFAHGASTPEPIASIRFEFANGSTTEAPVNRFSHPTLQSGFAAQGIAAPGDAGFQVTVPAPASLTNLTLITTGGIHAKWDHPPVGKAASLPATEGVSKVEAGIDKMHSSQPGWSVGARGAVFNALLRIGSSAPVWSIGALSALAVLLLRLSRKSGQSRMSPLLVAGILFALWSVGRVAFYAIISAGAWAAETRYLQAATILALCTILTALASLAKPKTSTLSEAKP
jgi:hypothetical protein